MKLIKRFFSRSGNPFQPLEDQESGWSILLRINIAQMKKRRDKGGTNILDQSLHALP